MRKKWMILAGCFFGGILICGLGAGIGFVEFSQFTYAGDRTLGTIREETLTYTAAEETDTYYVDLPWNRDAAQSIKMVSDNSLPKDTIEIDIQYNDDYEKPYLSEYFWDEEYIEESEMTVIEDDQSEMMVDEDDQSEMAAGEDDQSRETNAVVTKIKKVGSISICMDADPVKVIMRYKDIILEDIRNDQIGSYSNDWSQSIRIEEVRYNPSLEGKIELRH